MLYLGLLILLASGICQGSFGLWHKRYDPISWECFWGAFSLNGVILSLILATLTVDNLWEIVTTVSLDDVILPILCGMAWGASTIAFSKAILTVGMSLCFGISMGVSAVVGAIIPFVMQGQADTGSLILLVIAVIITLAGIATVTKGGSMKEEKTKSGNIKAGLILSVVSGLCSGFQNVGFALGKSIGSLASSDLQASIVQWFYILLPGMLTSLAICLVIALKNRSLSTLKNSGAPKRLEIILLSSVVWLAASQLYGISSKLLGNNGESVGWLMYNAIALIVSNFWGVRTGEWQDKKPRMYLYIGDCILVAAWAVIAFV